MTKIKIIISYCLPAIIALSIVLYGYYDRTQSVADTIMSFKRKVDNADDVGLAVLLKKETDAHHQTMAQLIDYLSRQKQEILFQAQTLTGKTTVDDNDVKRVFQGVLEEIWQSNSILICLMVLLPYIIFASRLAFSARIPLTPQERIESTKMNWWMKLSVAFVMTIGWVYLLNPSGRGVSTVVQFLIKQDLDQGDTLPIYIKPEYIVPVMAGFLGWYLYLLSYFFSKLVHHDVVSSRVYNLMFKKFLFTYGIAMVLPTIQSLDNTVTVGQGQSLFMFFIGFFPLAAFSMLKEAGMKFGGNFKSDSGYLTELPGIARWQVLRLEEEGIDNMAALAYASQKRLRASLLSMATVLDLWIDVAQLYVVVGEEAYLNLKQRCKTASGFLAKVEDEAFAQFLIDEKIGDVGEIACLLKRTFDGKLIPATV